MSEILTREQRLARGECLSTSSLIKQSADFPSGGVQFAVRYSGGDIAMVRITKPVNKGIARNG